ncbi:hypothetical protein T484DRAFT_1821986 [Baffinella frigidus]|nr:hypothetical protein T484DRAFT_1821986 [Cryptophyta sp. CCMP2293]
MEWPDGRLGVDQDPPASIQMEEAAGGFSGDQPQGEQEVLALPEPSSMSPPLPSTSPFKVTVDGGSISLEDEMGPLVVGADGSLARIANWGEMDVEERARTVRVLGKRNKLRLEKLRADGAVSDTLPNCDSPQPQQ